MTPTRMDFTYSKVIAASEYETYGLSEGIDLRKHEAADLEEVGAFRAQDDWRHLVGPVKSPYQGGLGPRINFVAVTVPECLPERIEIISYANEFAFLHDDITEVASRGVRDAANDEMLEAFEEGARTGKIERKGASGKRRIASQILQEMSSIDPARARASAKNWSKFLQDASGRQHHVRFESLEAYLPYRCLDSGFEFWHGIVTFGCALTIPEEELAETKELVMPGFAAMALANDLFSYEKEREDATRAGLPDVVNAIWVIMNEHGCDEREAKEICKKRIRLEVAKYVRVAQDTRKRKDLSDDTKRYIEALQYSISGNLAWSTQCPRYHKEAKLNELQPCSLRSLTGNITTDTKERSSLAASASEKTSLEMPTLKEEEKYMYWGANGVGVRIGNGVDENGAGHLHATGRKSDGKSWTVESAP